MRNWIFITSVVIVSLFWPNESGSEDFGSFWHITDPHIDPNYSCQGALGNYECDSPLSLWISALNNTKRLSLKPPDFVIFSGDSVAHDESLSRAKFLDVMRSAAQRLRLLFPDQQIPIIPVLGNHDTHPANVFEVSSESAAAEARRRWCGLLASDRDLWADWIAAGQPDPAANATRNSSEVFTSGCFFSRRIHISGGPSLVLISVNGMLWYSHNRKANSSLPDPAGQFAWLESTLSQARESNSKVLLICHFPPGATENSPTKYRHFFDNYNQRFLGLLRENTDILIGGLFAHQHTDTFRVLKEDDEPALPLLFGPSISPWHLGGLGAFNPRVRIFQFARSSLRLTDYQQLYLNLSSPTAQPAWALEYSFRAEYRLPDTSAASLSALLVDFAHAESNWSLYWQHQLGGLPHTSGACPPLGSVRRCRHLCAMFYLEYTELDRCLEGCAAGSPLSELLPSAFSADGGLPSTVRGVGTDAAAAATNDQWSPLPITVVVIVVFLAILLGVVLLVNRELCRRRRCNRGGHSLFNANQNGYFGCSAAEAAGRSGAGGGDLERFPHSLSASRLSSLDDVGGDGSLEVHTDEGALIRPGDGDRQTPLGRFSGLVRFSRTGRGGSCPDEPINSASAAARTKFGAFMEPTYPQLAYMSAGGGGSLRRATPSSDITDERGEEDEGVEAGDFIDDDYGDEEDNLELGLGYDAEGEEEEDFFFRQPPPQPSLLPPLSAPAVTNGSSSSNRASVNPKPLKDLLSPRLNNGNCLRTTPTPTSVAPPRKGHHHQSANAPSTQDEAHDLSDAEYYSLHSSLQYLHPGGGGGGTRGSSTSPDVVLASPPLLPTSQSASGAFGYTTAPGGRTTAHTAGDSGDSTVDGETPPSSDSLGGGSVASSSSASSSAVMSKPQRLLSTTTTASSGEQSGLLPTETSASVASSPVIRAPPSARSLPAAAEAKA